MSPWRPAVQPLPMWARWALAIMVAVAVVAAIVIAAGHAGPEGGSSEAAAEAEVNRTSDIAITEDQAPHSAALPPDSAPATALEQAIALDIHRRIAAAQLTGPLAGVTCHKVGTGSAGRAPYDCTARSAGIAYPFLAVVNARQRRLTWCKVDPVPVASVGAEIPISTSCRG